MLHAGPLSGRTADLSDSKRDHSESLDSEHVSLVAPCSGLAVHHSLVGGPGSRTGVLRAHDERQRLWIPRHPGFRIRTQATWQDKHHMMGEQRRTKWGKGKSGSFEMDHVARRTRFFRARQRLHAARAV